MTPLWRLLGASVAGTSHLKSGLPCQDAHACLALPGGVILAVADGAGSAERSAEGARCAADTVLMSLQANLKDGWPAGAAPWRELFTDAYADAKAGVDRLAEAAGMPARAFASTLLCAALSDDVLAVAQLGDGVAAGFSPAPDASPEESAGNDWFLAAEPQRGEYANETYFLSQADALQHLDIYVYAERVRALALMTDGLLRLVLDGQRRPHAPFFRPLLTFAVEVESPTAGQAQLNDFLRSDRVSARTDDDKTILLAVRRPPGWAP